MGTFVVIAASAIAALIQMRHMRSANQISLFTSYNTEFDSPEFTAAFAFVRTQLSGYVFSPDELDALAVGVYSEPLRAARSIGNFFEDMGSFVLTGVLHENIVCNLYSQNVLDAWHAMAPITFFVRKHRDTAAIWENFEFLYICGLDWAKKHGDGNYPKHMRRADLPSIETVIPSSDLLLK